MCRGWYFDKTAGDGRLLLAGIRRQARAGMFVVNPPGEEVDLQAADVEGLWRGRPVPIGRAIVAGTGCRRVARRRLQQRSEGTTLAPGVLINGIGFWLGGAGSR